MIRILKIKNFALIKDAEVVFDKGFNVIVGSTGAGKSLVVKALNFVFGAKPNKLDIRYGENKMTVQVIMESNKLIDDLLISNDIDCCDEIIIQRSYTCDGKSDIRINGYIVTAQLLKNLSELAIETYTQNESVNLLNTANQLKIIDTFCDDDIKELIFKLKNNNVKLKEINNTLDSLGGDENSRSREIDLLSYQISEIENAKLVIGEDEKIKERLSFLNSYEKISEISKLILTDLSTVVDYQMANCLSNFSAINSSDEVINSLDSRIRSSYYEIKDIYETFKDYVDNLIFDESEFNKLDLRMEEIKGLKKKYGDDIATILNYLQKSKERLEMLNDSASLTESIQKQKHSLCVEQYELCKRISDIRKSKANIFKDLITAQLVDVGMKNALFEVKFNEFPEYCDNINYSDYGLDKIEFVFSANAGQALKSLSKTSSGGELSRLMLSIKNVMAKSLKNGTFIFDEIDTGISGEIGYLVAKKIANISKNNQTICITHLPQVTAMADNYIKIEKYEEDGQTYSCAKTLIDNEIIDYIASMFGADKLTDSSKASALELKKTSENYKSSL